MKRVTLMDDAGNKRVVVVCETRDEFIMTYMPHINNMCRKLSYGVGEDASLLAIAFECVDKMFATLEVDAPPSTAYFDKIFRNEVAGIARADKADKSIPFSKTGYTDEGNLFVDAMSDFVAAEEIMQDAKIRECKEKALLAYLDARPTLKQELLNCIIHRDKGPGFQKAIYMLRQLLNDKSFITGY